LYTRQLQYETVDWTSFLKQSEAMKEALDTPVLKETPSPYVPVSPHVISVEKEEQLSVQSSHNHSKKSYHSTKPKMVNSQGSAYFTPNSRNNRSRKRSSNGSTTSSMSGKSIDKSSARSVKSALTAKSYDEEIDMLVEADPIDDLSVKTPRTANVVAIMSRAARSRTPMDSKIKWNGAPSTFDDYKVLVEGYLLQVGAGYLTRTDFQDTYMEKGESYLHSKEFSITYDISTSQALRDREALYGALQSSLGTQTKSNEYLTKHSPTKDGIKVWVAWVEHYSNRGSITIRIEELERELQEKYPTEDIGGVAQFIDQYLGKVSELTGL